MRGVLQGNLVPLAAATSCFVGSHFLLSGPLRRVIAKSLGRPTYLTIYSLVAIATLTWAIVAFDRAPATPALWDGTNAVAWALASVLTIVSLAFFIPSFAGNPVLPGRKAAGLGTVVPTGVFTITRHPMMWAFALWALAHIIVAPTGRSLIFMSGMIVLALLGSHFQDKRKIAGNNREFAPWQRRTSYWPRLDKLGAIGLIWLLAALVWVIITLIHWELFGIPAGLWRWIG